MGFDYSFHDDYSMAADYLNPVIGKGENNLSLEFYLGMVVNLKITCGLSLLLLDALFCWFIHDKKLELLLKP